MSTRLCEHTARAHACAFPLRRSLPQILPPWVLPGDKEASLPEGRARDPEGKGADQAPGGSSCPRPRPAPAQALPRPPSLSPSSSGSSSSSLASEKHLEPICFCRASSLLS